MNKKQAMTVDYLRDHCHLRARTDTIASVLRLRDSTMKSLQNYFTVPLLLSWVYVVLIAVCD